MPLHTTIAAAIDVVLYAYGHMEMYTCFMASTMTVVYTLLSSIMLEYSSYIHAHTVSAYVHVLNLMTL